MTRLYKTVLNTSLAVVTVFGGETRIQMKDLPPAVQKTVEEQTKGAQLKGLSKEVEHGKTFYEAETIVNGKSRDVLIDPNGAVVEVEQAVAIESIPAAAKAAIEKKAAGGKITLVESVTKGQTVTYEATIAKGLKKSEYAVNADGSPVK